MIKLNRGDCPEELTDEVREELTKLYKQNKHKDVWNNSKIKKPLKKALMDMSRDKCSYCECMLGIESKDVTIDHFLPKSVYADKVVEWGNLLPSCLRCNREKSDNEDALVNPCDNNPKEYFAVRKNNLFRFKGIDFAGIGKSTIDAIKLNDIQRVMPARMQGWVKLNETLEEIFEDFQEEGYKKKYINRFYKLMKYCTADNSYAAIKATNLLNESTYWDVKKMIQDKGDWTDRFQQVEDELKNIQLQIV